ncbi:MAG: DUF2336 domain-containing protein [Hyphomonadaceae bacterium]|nr:DUF2336 domain-containing protein [Hyphomonadaceae bacterium]
MVNNHPLVKLAADSSNAGREALVSATAGQFLDSPHLPTPSECALFCDVLVKLYGHARQEIRHRLSATLALTDWVPPSLLRELALDSFSIAQPVVSFSPILSDAIMLEVIETRDLAHRLCVAERPNINETITRKLIETENEKIVGAVARNATARIHTRDFHAAMKVLTRRQDDLDTLVTRHDLPPSLIATAYSLAGAQARISLSLRLPPRLEQRLSRLTAYVAADAADGHTTKAMSDPLFAKIQSYVRGQKQMPTPGSVLATLMRGEKDQFLKNIAKLLNLSEPRLADYLQANSPFNVALVARACNFDLTIARTFFETLDTTGRNWTLADDRMVAMLWMRNSVAAAKLQLASSLNADIQDPTRPLH